MYVLLCGYKNILVCDICKYSVGAIFFGGYVCMYVCMYVFNAYMYVLYVRNVCMCNVCTVCMCVRMLFLDQLQEDYNIYTHRKYVEDHFPSANDLPFMYVCMYVCIYVYAHISRGK